MTKRDRAHELFSQGRGKDDPEVVALGLKPESRRKYYREWERLSERLGVAEVAEPVVAEAPSMVVPREVSLSNIPDGNMFEYGGQTYKRRGKAYSGEVIVLPVYRAHYTSVFQPTGESLYLPPDIIVTPR